MKINLIFFLAIFFSVTTSGFSQSNSSNPILENTMEKKDPEGGKNQLDPDVLKKALNKIKLNDEKKLQDIDNNKITQQENQLQLKDTLIAQAKVKKILEKSNEESEISYLSDSDEGEKPRKSGKGADLIDPGVELVNMDFPELTDIKDIIKAVSLWTGRNVILDRNVTGKIQIISPKKVTKEEAYQAFLSALNMLGLTTVETGKVIKIMKLRSATKANLRTFYGSNWTLRTDEIISQIIPLKYVDAKEVTTTLSKIVSPGSIIAYEPTNTLIISDTGYQIKRVLDVLDMIDVQTQQPKVMIVPIKHSDPKDVATKVKEILKGSGSKKSTSYHTFKVLTDERTNSIIIFGPPRTIKDVKELVNMFDMPIDDPRSQASIHVRPLDYADAKKIATTLSSLTSGKNKNSSRGSKASSTNTGGAPSISDLGDGVKITSDEATNSLIITGSRAAYEALNIIVRKLDIRRSQVYVEADIIDISEQNDFNSGISIFAGALTSDRGSSANKALLGWEGAKMKDLILAQAQQGQTAATSITTLQGVANSFSQDFVLGILAGQSVELEGFGTFSPGMLINLIKNDGNSKILSSPQILTSNNEEATISVGEKVFYTTETTSTTGSVAKSVQKEDVDLTLTIKPNISYSNYITLNVQLESNFVKGISQNLPQVAKRKSKQLVTVKNSQTVVISGLMKSNNIESIKKIPLLGDIPILGWLFSNRMLSGSKSNLVIFITPHVIHGAGDLAAIYAAKIKERDEFMNKVFGSGYRDDNYFKSIPQLEDGKYKPDEIDKKENSHLEQIRRDAYIEMGYTSAMVDSYEKSSETKEKEITVPFVSDESRLSLDTENLLKSFDNISDSESSR